MQVYELPPHQERPVIKEAKVIRRQTHLSPIDLLEPLLLLLVGVLVMAPESWPPRTILYGLAALLAPYLLRWLLYGAPSRSTAADLPLALLLLVITPISLWVTPYFWEKTWPEFVRLVWGGAVLLAVVNWTAPLRQPSEANEGDRYRLPLRLWLPTFAYLLLGIGLGLLGLANMDIVTKIPYVDQVATLLREQDTTQLTLDDRFNPNRVAALLVLVAPLPLAFLLTSGSATAPAPRRRKVRHSTSGGEVVTQAFPGQQRGLGWRFVQGLVQGGWWLVRKWFWLALWLFFAGGLLLTQSRGGLVAALVGALVVLLLTWRQPEGGLRLTGGLFLLLFLAGMGYFTLSQQATAFFSGAATTLDKSSTRMVNTDSLEGRVIIWQRALNGLADQPLTGMGLAAFEEIAHQPYDLAGFIPGDLNHAHNLFLQVGLDFGLPGLIVFVALVVVALAALFRLYRTAPQGSQLSVWAIGVLGCMAAFLIYNQLDALTLGARPAVALWFLLGLALSAGHYAKTK